MATSTLMRTGRTWVFGDHINTDLIFPNHAFRAPLAEQPRYVFSANRPGWVDQVQEGDILIAGADFGIGSARPIGGLLRACGIRGIVAETVNGLAIRNCVNYGMPVMACPGVHGLFKEGEIACIDFADGRVENLSTGRTLTGMAMPPLLADITAAGGVLQMLVARDLVEPQPTLVASK